MEHRARLVLGVVMLVACGPQLDGYGGDEDPADGDPALLRQSCEAFYATKLGCTPAAEPFDAELACFGVEDTEEAWGRDCAAALERVYACEAVLACDVLVYGAAVDSPCVQHNLRANAACEGVHVSYCREHVRSGAACGGQHQDCLDGATYRLDCDAAVCVCSVDGEMTAEFAAPLRAAECDDAALAVRVVEDCGWPHGVPR